MLDLIQFRSPRLKNKKIANPKKFELAIKEAEFHNSIGCKAQILTAEECVKKEPTLVRIFDEKKLCGGIFYEMDASGNCMLFTKYLEKICREKYGVVFEYDVDVQNIFTNYLESLVCLKLTISILL